MRGGRSRAAAFTERDASAGANIDTATARLADLDRRIGQIDTAVDTSTRRGRTRGAMNLADEQRRNRASLAAERDRVNQEIAQLRAGRTGDGGASSGKRSGDDARPVCRAVRGPRDHRKGHRSGNAHSVAIVDVASVRRSAGADNGRELSCKEGRALRRSIAGKQKSGPRAALFVSRRTELLRSRQSSAPASWQKN